MNKLLLVFNTTITVLNVFVVVRLFVLFNLFCNRYMFVCFKTPQTSRYM